jgi:diguanylate cyclase (GGDEF)-like protein/PAS domain S-box-containing protein
MYAATISQPEPDRRGTPEAGLHATEESYRLLFESNPVPMWVFNRQTLRFLAVNDAAVHQYGYTEQEFLAMTIAEIRPREDVPALLDDMARRSDGLQQPGIWRHCRKNGTILDVQVLCHSLEFHEVPAMFVSAYEITERKRAEEATRVALEFAQSTIDALSSHICVLDEEGTIIAVNRAWREFSRANQRPGEAAADEVRDGGLEGTRYLDVCERATGADAVEAKAFADGVRAVLCGQRDLYSAEYSCDSPTERRWFLCRVTRFPTRPVRVLVEHINITDRKRAEESLLFKTALLEAQTETAIDAILVVDDANTIVLANQQFGRLFDIPPKLLHAGNDLAVRKYVTDRMQDPDEFIAKVLHLYRHRDQKSRDELRLRDGKTLDRYSAPLVDSTGRYRGRIWYFRDITDRKAAEERSLFLAYHDALTELPHRALLQDRLTNALAGARRRNERIALLFLDLDRFKNINDTFGHGCGDGVLKEVACRLRTWAREQDTVARLGGDEFLVMLNGVKDAASAAVAAERLLEAINCDFVIHGQTVGVGCSIGISMFPDHGLDGETLIRNADRALYSAKENGRGNVRFFTGEMNAQAVERLSLERNLRLALERDEFFLEYQPQAEIATGRVTGFEALLRWRQPEMGLVPPANFIPIAENSGLILPIGEWVLRTACAQGRRWLDEGLFAVPVAVKVSALQFRQEGFVSLIRSVLAETGLPPHLLELELTESLLFSNADVIPATMRELEEMGLKLAIDDFGTGYSSFTYLRQFRVSKLKIDRSFVRDLALDSDAAITAAIISMARSLRLEVVAEGVEEEAQIQFLREHGCGQMQGYYFSRPLPVDEVIARFASAAAGPGDASAGRVRQGVDAL